MSLASERCTTGPWVVKREVVASQSFETRFASLGFEQELTFNPPFVVPAGATSLVVDITVFQTTDPSTLDRRKLNDLQLVLVGTNRGLILDGVSRAIWCESIPRLHDVRLAGELEGERKRRVDARVADALRDP